MQTQTISRRIFSGMTAAVIAASCAGLAYAPLTAFAADEPNTYDTLEVDRAAKQEFEKKTAAKTKLPVINVTTYQNSELILSKEVYTKCVVDVFNVDSDLELDEVSAGIRVRGNSSAYYGDEEQIKKNTVPYRIKFDKKQSMLGLNDGAKCKSWVLLKSDWNLVANDLALRMGREIFDDTAYVSDSQFVHLYVNDKLQGTYVLCEQNQVNEYRVNITEPEKDYTGTDFGWYLELDNYAARENPDGTPYNDDPYITMDYEGATVTDIRGTERQFEPAEYSIKNDVYTDEQIAFIEKYLNNVFELIYKATEKGEYLTFDENYDLVPSSYTNAQECIEAVTDIESIVDMYLLYEIVHDYDCGEGSFYMCVDFAENSNTPKLQFTSPWDFNWAYNDSTMRYWAGAFCTESFARSYGDRSNPWLILFAKQDWFHDLCTAKWEAESQNVRNTLAVERQILADYEQDLNAKEEYGTSSAEGTISWVEKRLGWMDKTFSSTIDISDYDVTLSADKYTYDGKAKTPDVTVNDGRTVLSEDTDYDVVYTDNVNAGTAKVSVTGKGKYVGSIEKTFTITPASLFKATASTSAKKYVYTGKARKPAVTVKLNGKKLIKNVDYTVTYSANKNTGKATYTVKGIGNYYGSKNGSFIIKPKKLTVKKLTTPKTKQLKVFWKKAPGNVTGYQIQTALNKKFTKSKVNTYVKKPAATAKTIKDLKKGKTYFVRVRAYKKVGNTKYFGAFSTIKKIRVK